MSGPSSRIASSNTDAAATPSVAPSVLGTLRKPGRSGSKGSVIEVRPVAERAPIVVPWYERSRLITFVFAGLPLAA